MLMLYLFKVEVFDLGLNYPYTTDCVVIGDTHEDRARLLDCQFGDHSNCVVKRAVLLGARALTLRETNLLDEFAGAKGRVWLMTRLTSAQDRPPVRLLPRLYDECSMLKLELLDRSPARYHSTPLKEDQYMHSIRFSKIGDAALRVRLAA